MSAVMETESGLWERRARQLKAVFDMELGKAMFSKRARPVWILAIVPIAFLGVVEVVALSLEEDTFLETMGAAREFYSYFFSSIVLGGTIFFGCAWAFTNLFRGEMLNRSLHYYLLTPARREVLVAGKFVAGLVTVIALFSITTGATYLLLYLPFGNELANDVVSGALFGQIFAYLGVTWLAVLGYGGVFLLLGVVFRNPIVPIGVYLGIEVFHFVLPPLLKPVSVLYYLKGVLPVPMDEGPFAVIVAPPEVFVAVFALLALAVVANAIAVWKLKRMEIQYTED